MFRVILQLASGVFSGVIVGSGQSSSRSDALVGLDIVAVDIHDQGIMDNAESAKWPTCAFSMSCDSGCRVMSGVLLCF